MQRELAGAHRHELGPAPIESDRDGLAARQQIVFRVVALGVMERELSHGQDYLLGSELTLADFFMLPSTFAFSLIEEGRRMYPKFPAFCRWREHMENLATTKKLRAILPPREPIWHAREWANSHRPKY